MPEGPRSRDSRSMKDHLKAIVVVLVALGIGIVGWQKLMKAGTSASEVEHAQQRLPTLQLKTIDGRDVQTADLKGKLVIVNFWASWCGPCIEEVPSLVKLSEALGDDLRILAISGDSSMEDVNAFLKSFPTFKRAGVDIVLDEGLKIAKDFNVARLPESFIYDGEGKIARKIAGSIDWATPEAIAYMKALKK